MVRLKNFIFLISVLTIFGDPRLNPNDTTAVLGQRKQA